MKKEDFVSTLVMTTVSILMLVGVTIAWYTAVYAHPTVTGMNMTAAEKGSIKIALTSGGEDISVLQQDGINGNELADIGLTELLNIVDGQMAPGAYGEVTFYVTSLDQDITKCQIVPSLVPGYEEGVTVTEETEVTINNKDKNILALLDEHFDFYTNTEMTQLVSDSDPMDVTLEWDTTNNKGIEKTVTLYWKWHYEYPFTQEELNTMTADAEKAAIYQYDMEDTWIGTHLDTMSFHFDFLIQQ